MCTSWEGPSALHTGSVLVDCCTSTLLSVQKEEILRLYELLMATKVGCGIPVASWWF